MAIPFPIPPQPCLVLAFVPLGGQRLRHASTRGRRAATRGRGAGGEDEFRGARDATDDGVSLVAGRAGGGRRGDAEVGVDGERLAAVAVEEAGGGGGGGGGGGVGSHGSGMGLRGEETEALDRYVPVWGRFSISSSRKSEHAAQS